MFPDYDALASLIDDQAEEYSDFEVVSEDENMSVGDTKECVRGEDSDNEFEFVKEIKRARSGIGSRGGKWRLVRHP